MVRNFHLDNLIQMVIIMKHTELILHNGSKVRLKRFTEREKQVLCYLAMGIDEKGIATLLNKSNKTISHFKLSAMKKIGIKKDANLIKWLRTLEAKHLIVK